MFFQLPQTFCTKYLHYAEMQLISRMQNLQLANMSKILIMPSSYIVKTKSNLV